jgi:hypothetical protein
MIQLNLKLKPIIEQQVPTDISLALRSLYDCLYFNFSGRIDLEGARRKGQFQYRYGRKVLPTDKLMNV